MTKRLIAVGEDFGLTDEESFTLASLLEWAEKEAGGADPSKLMVECSVYEYSGSLTLKREETDEEEDARIKEEQARDDEQRARTERHERMILEQLKAKYEK